MIDLWEIQKRIEKIDEFERIFLYSFKVKLDQDVIEQLEADGDLRTSNWMFTVLDEIIESSEDFQRVLKGRADAYVDFRHGDPASDSRILPLLRQLRDWKFGECDQDEFED